MVQQVIALNEALSILTLGAQGEFYFDKLFVCGRGFRSQLWGIKTSDGLVAFDRDIRKRVTFLHLGVGTVMLPFFGMGLLILAFAVPQFLKLIAMTGARKRMFYGGDRAEARRLRKLLAVRI